ncbi:unnamed protein product [Periconia digitata]|uniref:Uncharacterized protein n=1 Tax=Periconia digitata TaxID=1303443 RepID=A0A9W4USQ0_9PLEO|nr:unnamed protein product [Periconia digitata]
MQSAAGRRAIATLASKLHPPTPLSTQESKQLLGLLTTSFRTHLDREHPIAHPNDTHRKSTSRTQLVEQSQTPHPASSYTSAHDHIDSILANPLISRKPAHKHSGNDAVRLLEDPVEWFLDQMAIGAADLPKALLFLQMAKENSTAQNTNMKSPRNPATIVTDWLQSSGLENSSQFLEMLVLGKKRGLLKTLFPMLMHDEKNQAPLWRWLTRSPKQRMKETGLSANRILVFRTQLLKEMGSYAYDSNRDEGLTIFLRALNMCKSGEHDFSLKMIQPLGGHLVGRIEREPSSGGSTNIYDLFLNSSSAWLSTWSKAVEAMLWLHHPTKPTAYPGLELIIASQGQESFMQNIHLSNSRRLFMVRLSFGVAQHLLDQEKSVEAQMAMRFAQQHFGDLVLPKTPHPERTSNEKTRQKKEEWSLQMLDNLLPT